MKGEQLARIVEQLLAERGIGKGAFYSAVGISATALYGWKRGAEPKRNSKTWYNRIMVGEERVYISAPTEEEYYAKARAVKSNLIEIEKSRPKLTLGTAMQTKMLTPILNA